MKYRLLFVCLIAIFSACSEDKDNQPRDFTEQNEAEILAYIAANNLTATRSITGLHYIIDTPGTGAQPNATSNVTVVYKGTYLDGRVFDQSDANGITIGLNQVIPGWTEGIAYFREGGSGLLLIPAHLGYGSFTNRGIPGGSVLIFEIDLLSVN